MAVKVRVITQYFDDETDEVLFSRDKVGESDVPCDEFDFSTKEGILVPFDALEGTLLDAAYDSMRGATEQFMAGMADAKKKRKSTQGSHRGNHRKI